MLQYIAEENERYSIAEQMQMAIEGGCKWVVLSVPDKTDEEIRELAREIIPLCKETSTILTIENHIELAKELAIHGVLLRDNGMTAAAVREQLGPEAIIGVEVGIASAVLALRSADIDYVSFRRDMPIERLGENVEALRGANIDLALVAAGDYPLDRLAEVMDTGVNGVALARTIGDSHDPVETTEKALRIIM